MLAITVNRKQARKKRLHCDDRDSFQHIADAYAANALLARDRHIQPWRKQNLGDLLVGWDDEALPASCGNTLEALARLVDVSVETLRMYLRVGPAPAASLIRDKVDEAGGAASIMQGDDDQIVPYPGAGKLQAELVKRAVLKVYPGKPHGLTDPEEINADLLAFIPI